ncbi:hypothetical protein G6F57_020486 [Rhizopus arrhizus]|nr:hypothetical protein G6F57_020486 [Rhizopus arrhizus]
MRRAFFICACKIRVCADCAATNAARTALAPCKPKAPAKAVAAKVMAAKPKMDITPAPAGRATMKVDPLQTALVCLASLANKPAGPAGNPAPFSRSDQYQEPGSSGIRFGIAASCRSLNPMLPLVHTKTGFAMRWPTPGRTYDS